MDKKFDFEKISNVAKKLKVVGIIFLLLGLILNVIGIIVSITVLNIIGIIFISLGTLTIAPSVITYVAKIKLNNLPDKNNTTENSNINYESKEKNMDTPKKPEIDLSDKDDIEILEGLYNSLTKYGDSKDRNDLNDINVFFNEYNKRFEDLSITEKSKISMYINSVGTMIGTLNDQFELRNNPQVNDYFKMSIGAIKTNVLEIIKVLS